MSGRGSAGLRRVNQLFLRYLARRRLQEEYHGDLHVEQRREGCLELAAWLDALLADGMDAEADEFQRMFDREMEKVTTLQEVV